MGSWQWVGHALWQCQGKARRAGVQACSCLCSGPANGMGLGRPYGTCEKNWELWRLACGVTRQSPVRNGTGQGQTYVITPRPPSVMDVLADGDGDTPAPEASICPERTITLFLDALFHQLFYICHYCQPFTNSPF